MEYWSDGVLEYWISKKMAKEVVSFPVLQYSNTPGVCCSTPVFCTLFDILRHKLLDSRSRREQLEATQGEYGHGRAGK
jgi:hypothetical protein